MSIVSSGSASLRIRIRKIPPTEQLEGIDLRHYQFREGQVYDVGWRLAEMLMVWGYAEPEMRGHDRGEAADKSRR